MEKLQANTTTAKSILKARETEKATMNRKNPHGNRPMIVLAHPLDTILAEHPVKSHPGDSKISRRLHFFVRRNKKKCHSDNCS